MKGVRSMEERLQKFLASAGVASRRKAEELIAEGRVKVNGEIVSTQGFKIDVHTDKVSVDDKEIKANEEKIYVMLNKPPGYLTTVKDDFDRPTVMNLLTGINERVFPVGRLDFETTGLLFLTNDGEFTYKLTHPKHEKTKTYVALVYGEITEENLDKLRQGVMLEDGITAPAECKIISIKEGQTFVEIIIHEGRKRQIRRMLSYIGHDVIQLTRTAVGNLDLGQLKQGEYRLLSEPEIAKLLG